MPYGVVTSLSAPIEVYDQIHTQVIGKAALAIEGLLLHIGRPSPAGCEVIEVWESQAHYDRYQRERHDQSRPVHDRRSQDVTV